MQRNKGKRGEREVVELAREAGLKSSRTWETAQSTSRTNRQQDVLIAGLPHQVKFQSRGFAALYAALEGVAGVFVRENGKQWLAVIPAEDYLSYLKVARSQDLPDPATVLDLTSKPAA